MHRRRSDLLAELLEPRCADVVQGGVVVGFDDVSQQRQLVVANQRREASGCTLWVKAASCSVQRKQPVHSGFADVKVRSRLLEGSASPLTEGEDALAKVEGEWSRHQTVRSRQIADGIGRSIDGGSAVDLVVVENGIAVGVDD